MTSETDPLISSKSSSKLTSSEPAAGWLSDQNAAKHRIRTASLNPVLLSSSSFRLPVTHRCEADIDLVEHLVAKDGKTQLIPRVRLQENPHNLGGG